MPSPCSQRWLDAAKAQVTRDALLVVPSRPLGHAAARAQDLLAYFGEVHPANSNEPRCCGTCQLYLDEAFLRMRCRVLKR